MLKRIWHLLKENPTWILLIFAILFAGVNLLFLGGKYQKERLTQRLAEQVAALETNVDLLQEAESEGLQKLQDELSAAQDYLASLKGAFTEIESSFDLFRSGYTLASLNDADLISIHRLGAEIQPTIFGTFEITNYSVVTSVDLQPCLDYLSDLESEGSETLALNNIGIEPELAVCTFEVRIAGLALIEVE